MPIRTRLLAGSFAVAAVAAAQPLLAQDATQLHEMTVTGTREGELKSETPASVSVVGEQLIKDLKPAHPSELMSRIPGAAISVTNGEGHTTGIRHPIGTSPVYLYLEDGIPTRATGFFNHNALFETNLPQAGGLEVTRGPGSALQGSDAIGAVINVLTKAPSEKPEATVTAEAGSYGWMRALASASNSWGDTGARGDLNLTHTDGWRQRTEYDRQSTTLRVDTGLSNGAVLKAVVSGSNINMQTGASARLTEDDYKHNPTANYHSIAYRQVQAVRGSVSYEQEDGPSLFSLTPYVRYNRMEMMPSFQLNSDPVISTTGHASLGLMARYRRDFEPWRTRVVTGVDLDYSPGVHDEDRILPTKSGNYYTGYKNLGKLYDYDVVFQQASPYVHAETSPLTPLRIDAGLRLDIIRYDYDNHLQTGSVRTNVNGTTNTFFRPTDTTRDYSHLSPSLGATWQFDPALNGFVRYKHSFRAPSESDLFRQGKNTDSIHLSPVKVDNYEVGLRGPDKGELTWEVSYYTMLKRDDILTANPGGTPTSTNNGKTAHRGVEVAAGWRFLPDWQVNGNLGYARHYYRHWLSSSGTFDGNDIPSAPRTVSSLALAWQPTGGLLGGLKVEAEWTHLGAYQTEESNVFHYNGHDLFNLRGSYQLTEDLELFARLMNLADTRWASNAQFSSNRNEFQPGLPRTVYGGVTVRF